MKRNILLFAGVMVFATGAITSLLLSIGVWWLTVFLVPLLIVATGIILIDEISPFFGIATMVVMFTAFSTIIITQQLSPVAELFLFNKATIATNYATTQTVVKQSIRYGTTQQTFMAAPIVPKDWQMGNPILGIAIHENDHLNRTTGGSQIPQEWHNPISGGYDATVVMHKQGRYTHYEEVINNTLNQLEMLDTGDIPIIVVSSDPYAIRQQQGINLLFITGIALGIYATIAIGYVLRR